MRNLVNEIHRRSLWQVLGIYLAGSWVALQVVETLVESAGLPDWVQPLALVLLVIGFPIVMATAFIQEGMGGKPASEPEVAPTEADRATAEAPPKPATARGLLTWRNALVGGVGAFALLGLAAAGWLGMRALGIGPAATLVAQGVLEERDRVVLADFSSLAEDPGLGEALTEALRIELGNSQVLDVVDGAAVSGALRRMQREPSDGLPREVALELAVREGHKAVIAGEVRQVGNAYQLSADVLRAADGTSLAGFRETAKDADGLIEAIDALSRDLRAKAGESIRSVRGGAPLERVSTASLEALERYSEGRRAFDQDDLERSRSLLEEAVAIDSGFAMAYRALGVVYENLRERQHTIDAMRRAFRHRDRLTRKERLHVEGLYHIYVTGDRSAAVRAFEELIALDPGEKVARHNLAVALGGSDPERAVELYTETIRLGTPAVVNYLNLAGALAYVGDGETALATLEEAEARFPDAGAIPLRMAEVHEAFGRYEEAEMLLAAVAERFRGTYAAEVEAPATRMLIASERGQLRRAAEVGADLEPRIAEAGRARDLMWVALQPAYGALYGARDPARARQLAAAALVRHPLDSLPLADRPTLAFAELFAKAGDPERASSLLARWQSERTAGDPSPPTYERVQALIALARGDTGRGIGELVRLTAPQALNCPPCARFALGVAYEAAGRSDSAIVHYEAYLDGTQPYYWREPGPSRAYALERLGALYEGRARPHEPPSVADLERAAKYYAMFVELWSEADDVLQPRVRAAQARLEEILRERG